MKPIILLLIVITLIEFVKALCSQPPAQPDYEFGTYFLEESKESALKHFHVR